MIDGMGIVRTTVAVAHPARPTDTRELIDIMVDTGSEYNWLPRSLLEELGVEPVRVDRFQTADGRELEREMGVIMLYAGGRSTGTMAAFAEKGDLLRLGAHGLKGLNLRVDLVKKTLVPAGPVPAAASKVALRRKTNTKV